MPTQDKRRLGVLSPRINGDPDKPMQVCRIWDLPGQVGLFGELEEPEEGEQLELKLNEQS